MPILDQKSKKARRKKIKKGAKTTKRQIGKGLMGIGKKLGS